MKIPKKPFLMQTIQQEANGTWTAFRYMLCVSTGSSTKREALQMLRQVGRLGWGSGRPVPPLQRKKYGPGARKK